MKSIKEVDEAGGILTSVLKRAIDNHVPNIKTRTLLLPEANKEMRSLISEAKRLKILSVNGIDYINNRGRLLRIRETLIENGWKRGNRWRET